MRKSILVFCIVLISLVSFSNEKVVLAIGDWAPYTSENDPNGKLAEKIVEEAFKIVSIDVEIKYYPWKRSYENVKAGREAGTFPWYSNDERKELFIINKEPIIETKTVFFYLKNIDFKWESFNDLKKYTVGTLASSVTEKMLIENGVKAEPVKSMDQNFKKLLYGRVDLVAEEFIVGYDTINKTFEKEKAALFTNDPKPLISDSMHMLFSKEIPNGQEISDKLDEGLKKIKESGRYDEIIAEFFSK